MNYSKIEFLKRCYTLCLVKTCNLLNHIFYHDTKLNIREMKQQMSMCIL
jgi:hypothetical protein